MMHTTTEPADVEAMAFNKRTAAKVLSVSLRLIEREIERGRLKAFKLGGRTLIEANEIKRYIAANTVKSAA